MDVAVIPALDEGRAIGSVVLKAHRHVHRVVVVDDGSRDDTAAVARLAGADVVSHASNRGKGAAMRTGIDAAMGLGASVIVFLDGDGQHDADEIPRLLKMLAEGADLVVGARTRPGDGAPTKHRRFGRNVLDGLTNAASRTAVTDTQSGFRAMTAKAAAALSPAVDGMGVESRMLLDASRQGLSVAEVEITEHYPAGVRPHVAPVRHGASVVRSIVGFVRDEYPLAVFGGGGILLIAVGTFLGAQAADHFWSTGEFWPGRAMESMLAIVLGSIGVVSGLMMDFLASRLPRR